MSESPNMKDALLKAHAALQSHEFQFTSAKQLINELTDANVYLRSMIMEEQHKLSSTVNAHALLVEENKRLLEDNERLNRVAEAFDRKLAERLKLVPAVDKDAETTPTECNVTQDDCVSDEVSSETANV